MRSGLSNLVPPCHTWLRLSVSTSEIEIERCKFYLEVLKHLCWCKYHLFYGQHNSAVCHWVHLRTSKILKISVLTIYSVEQSPCWESKRFSASQEIHRNLCNTNFHYCIHTWPAHVPILDLCKYFVTRYVFMQCRITIIYLYDFKLKNLNSVTLTKNLRAPWRWSE